MSDFPPKSTKKTQEGTDSQQKISLQKQSTVPTISSTMKQQPYRTVNQLDRTKSKRKKGNYTDFHNNSQLLEREAYEDEEMTRMRMLASSTSMIKLPNIHRRPQFGGTEIKQERSYLSSIGTTLVSPRLDNKQISQEQQILQLQESYNGFKAVKFKETLSDLRRIKEFINFTLQQQQETIIIPSAHQIKKNRSSFSNVEQNIEGLFSFNEDQKHGFEEEDLQNSTITGTTQQKKMFHSQQEEIKMTEQKSPNTFSKTETDVIDERSRNTPMLGVSTILQEEEYLFTKESISINMKTGEGIPRIKDGEAEKPHISLRDKSNWLRDIPDTWDIIISVYQELMTVPLSIV